MLRANGCFKRCQLTAFGFAGELLLVLLVKWFVLLGERFGVVGELLSVSR